MNIRLFKQYLATGERTAAMDAAPIDLAAHDKIFHPNGYKEGDRCKVREAMALGDDADRLEEAGKEEAKGDIDSVYRRWNEIMDKDDRDRSNEEREELGRLEDAIVESGDFRCRDKEKVARKFIRNRFGTLEKAWKWSSSSWSMSRRDEEIDNARSLASGMFMYKNTPGADFLVDKYGVLFDPTGRGDYECSLIETSGHDILSSDDMLPYAIARMKERYSHRQKEKAWNSMTSDEQEAAIRKGYKEVGDIGRRFPGCRISNWLGIGYSGPRRFDVVGRDYNKCREAALWAKKVFERNGILTHDTFGIGDDDGYGFRYGTSYEQARFGKY